MEGRSARKVIVCLLLLLALSHTLAAQTAPPGKCQRDPADYNGYTVRAVRLDAPLGWLFPSVTQQLNTLLSDPGLPLKQGDPFDKGKYFASFEFLRQQFPALQVNPLNRVAVRLAAPRLANCDEQQRTLETVYSVYHLALPEFLSSSFEPPPDAQNARAVADTAATRRLANYFPQPFLGYNRARAGFGGTKLTINQPGYLFDKLTLEGSGSVTGLVTRAELQGARSFAHGPLQQAEWRAGHRYSDVPSRELDVKESAAAAQFTAATRAYGNADFMLRFGAAVEGGHQQSDLSAARLSPEALARTGYAAGKAFVGTTLRQEWKPNEQPLELRLKASYGLQVGNTGEGRRVDYVKQLFDSAALLRYRVRDHRPLSLETQFTSGALKTLGRVPVTERFFGGNAEQNFIAGDSWMLRSQPFIRSFPQNRFAQTGPNNGTGGDRFFALNVTLAATVWGKPLVPEEILGDELDQQVEFQLGTAESALVNTYLADLPAFREFAKQVTPLATPLQTVRQTLADLERAAQALGAQPPGPALLSQIESCRAELDLAGTSVQAVIDKLAQGNLSTSDFRILLVGIGSRPARLTRVTNALQALAGLPDLPATGDIAEKIASLQRQSAELETTRKRLGDAFTAQFGNPTAPAVVAANAYAQRTMRYPRRVLNELLHEANLIGISPVFIFDAARLWQHGQPAGATRYGVGGGVRLSIVSFDVTLGYAWNLRTKPFEDRGALVFTMSLSNLFR